MKTPIAYADLTRKLARSGCWVIGMPNEAYHAYEGISNSGLGDILRSPAHYAYRTPWKSSRAMEIGTAFHTALLEPKRYAKEYITVSVDDRRKAEYKQAKEIYGGERTLTLTEGAGVGVMLESARGNAEAVKVFNLDGYAELSGFVECPDTGALLRVRFDWLADNGPAVDVKKTQDARAWAFSAAVYRYGYHRQAAFYSHVYKLIEGAPLPAFKFLAIEEQPPCANVLYELDYLAMQQGEREFREALETYSECHRTGYWPAYEQQADVISLPEYALRDIEEEVI